MASYMSLGVISAPMAWTVEELAERIGGAILGDGALSIESLTSIDEAHGRSIAPLLRKDALAHCSRMPGAVLTSGDLGDIGLEAGVQSVILHPHPVLGMARLIDVFFPPGKPLGGIHPSAVVHEDASIHGSVGIGPLAVVEKDVHIGEGSHIGAGAIVCSGTRIGANVDVGPGAVIGSDGFGFIPTEEGPIKVRHVGRVVIEDHVSIGANTCVDRATLGTTSIGRATKIDNLVQIGHNVHIGARSLIAGQTGLAGSTVVGDDVMLGGQVGVADHLSVGDRSRVAAQSGVVGDVCEGDVVAGYPAVSHRKWLRAMGWLMRESARKTNSESEE